jgi:hypothetical protein
MESWLRACIAFLVLTTGSAAAEAPADKLPNGYTSHMAGAVRWTYPTAARGEVEALQATHVQAWSDLSEMLGVPLAADLDIRLAVNPEDMQVLAPKGAKLPAYASGVALSKHGIVLLSLTTPKTFRRPDMRGLLVHELAHVALHRATLGHGSPRWFSEGFAIHAADEHSLARLRVLWEGALRGNLQPLSSIDHEFHGHDDAVDLAYAQSADFVRYLIEGADEHARLHALVGHLAAGQTLEDATQAAYGLPLPQLERAWREALLSRFGRWPTLLTGLTVVWVIGAVFLVVGYVRVRRRHRRVLARWETQEKRDIPIAAQPAAVAPPPPPPANAVSASRPPPVPDQVFDHLDAERRRDPEVPTVHHEGQNHTLH